jgi:hypothetical protein
MLAVNGLKSGSVLQMNGQLTLEQMSLDRKDEFAGDAFDPFNYQQKQQKDTSGIQLQQSANYMGVNNTIGSKIWTPD